VLAVGGGALSLAALAKGVAPRQAILACPLADPEMPGVDAALDESALARWIDGIAGAAKPGGGVGVAAR